MGWGEAVAVRRREHELAGDVRAGSWARAKARTKQRDFLRRNWRLIGGFAALMLTIGALVSLLTANVFLKGLIAGVVLATVPSLIWSWTVQVTGTGPVMMGDQAEQWSAAELRKLRRQGWRLANHFLLRRGNIDHVLIGPAGVWIVETKWCSSWDTGFAQDRIRDAAAQVSASARSMGLWDPMRKRGVQIRPVVVLWGAGLPDDSHGDPIAVIDGVPVVSGRSLVEWTTSLPHGVLDPTAVDDAWSVIERQAGARDATDREANPIPLSFEGYLFRASFAVSGFAAAVLSVTQLWGHLPSTTWCYASSLLALVPAAALFRVRLLRPVLWGWIGGVGLVTAALTALLALDALR